SPRHRGVGISDIQNTLFDEVHNFTVESSLKPVRDMANHFFPLTIRFPAENKCFRFCGCLWNVRARLWPAKKSRARYGGTIRSSISIRASTQRSRPYAVP